MNGNDHAGELYTLIVPRLDRTGPTNLAVDLANGAAARGLAVTILYLGGSPVRRDLHPRIDVRRFRASDVLRTRGVVHAHGFRPDLVAGAMALAGRCATMTTLHGHFPHHIAFDHGPARSTLAWRAWRLALGRMDVIVCLSQTMRRFYQQRLPADRLAVAYNFRDTQVSAESLAPVVSKWLEGERRQERTVLVYVGSLITRKNVVPLAEAVARSANLSLIMCGDGPLRPALEAIAAEAGGHIHLAGHVSEPAQAIAAGDWLVLPSFAEGLSLAVLEAAQLGVPLLLSNIAVHREVASLGLGQTFDHRRFTDLAARAMGSVPNAIAPLDERLRIWQEHFSVEAGMARYLALIEQAAGTHWGTPCR